jgi:hypothetical protein
MSPTQTTYAPARPVAVGMSPSLAVALWFGVLGLVVSLAVIRMYRIELVNQVFSLLG